MNNQPTNQTPLQSAPSVLDAITRRLRLIGFRARLALLSQSILRTISLIIVASLGMGLVDFMLRLPMAIRVVALVGILYLLFQCIVRYIRPASLFRLSPTDVALHIEQHDPSVRGLLAGAVDLHDSSTATHRDTSETQISDALSDAAIANAAKRLENHTYPRVLSFKHLARSAGVFAILIGCVLGLGFSSWSHLHIGIHRVFMPWNDARWPMRYPIMDRTDDAPRALDIAVPIRVLIGSARSDEQSPARGEVDWRLLDSAGKSITSWNHSPLVAQRRRDEQTGIPLYEQLLDANQFASPHADNAYTLEYKLSTNDDATGTKRIMLARPPELLETTIDIALPPYASALRGSETVQSGIVNSSSHETIVSPILAQSSITITWKLSKPIRQLDDDLPQWALGLGGHNADNDSPSGSENSSGNGSVNGSEKKPLVQLIQPNPTTLKLTLEAQTSATIEPGIVDTMGIPIRTPVVLSLGVLTDQSPGASIILPAHDETVSAHALIEVQGELTDDFGLSFGSLHTRIARRPAGSAGAPHELLTNANMQAGVLVEEPLHSELRANLSGMLDLSTLDLRPDDQVWVHAMGWDLRRSESDVQAGLTQSPIRVLSIVSDTDLIDRIRTGVNPIRSAMRQLDEQQSELINKLRNDQLKTSNEQRSITDRIEANQRSIDQMIQSIDRNRLDDPSLKEQLIDASSILDEAAQAGQRASDQIDRGQSTRAIEQQEVVQDRIGELLTMLDRGQDSYLAMRSVQQLRDQIESIRDETAQLNAQAGGRSLEQLSAQERSTLDQILEQQIDAADDARDALSLLDEQAEQLEEHDPTQAQALQDAAEKGRRAQLEERLREAGEQIASNQTSSATQTQSEVLDELDKMLEELEKTTQNRDNALRRALASIIDSIKGLIRSQQTEVDRLGAVDALDLPSQLDAPAIALVGNTLTVRDDALGAFPETRIIADLLGKAGNAQNLAITSLRQSPPDIASARRSDQTSLLNLNKALEEAERLDEQAAKRQAQRLRNQLRDAYRASLEAAVALRDETILLSNSLDNADAQDRKLSRRQRATARAIAGAQTQIQEDLSDLLEQTKELNESPVFKLAHSQLDTMISKIVTELNQRTLSPRVITTQDSTIMILTTLVKVLSDQQSDQDPEDFDDGQSGGSSGGSGGGEEPVIPPVAQLILLRSMQQLAATQTRMMNQSSEPVSAEDIQALSDLQSQLFEHGMDLIEQMSNKPSPTPSTNDLDAPDEPEQPIELDEGSTES